MPYGNRKAVAKFTSQLPFVLIGNAGGYAAVVKQQLHRILGKDLRCQRLILYKDVFDHGAIHQSVSLGGVTDQLALGNAPTPSAE